MSDYTIKKLSELTTEYTVEPDANDLAILQHIVSDQTCKMKWSTVRGCFVSTSTASVVDATTTWKDSKCIRIGTDADMQLCFDGTNFIMKNVTSNSDIIVSASPAGVLTEVLRVKAANNAIQFPTTTYLNGSGSASAGLHFTSTEIHSTLLVQFESKTRHQNSLILNTNCLSYSGDAASGLSFDSNDYGTFAARLTSTGLFTASSKIYAKDTISYNGTGGMLFDSSGNVVQTGTFSSTGKISTTGASGDIEAKRIFICNSANGITATRVVTAGKSVTITGGIITNWET